jgi:hypothetical protein
MGGVDVGGAPGPILDDQARRAYEADVGELQAEIDGAKAANDWMRADRAEAELDALFEQLSPHNPKVVGSNPTPATK